MANKKAALSGRKMSIKTLQVIRIDTFKPSLRTLSSVDCGIDLSSYAYAGLRSWSK